MDRIAQELVDKVIDEFSNNVHVLKQCSLVAKRWAPRSQGHLFARMEFITDQISLWEEATRPVSNLLASYVRTLILRRNYGVIHSTWFRSWPSFINLQTLALQGFNFDYVQEGSLANAVRPLGRTVTSLKLSWWCCSPNELVGFVHLFPLLEDLEIEQPNITSGTTKASLCPTLAPLRGQIKLLLHSSIGADKLIRVLCRRPMNFRRVVLDYSFYDEQGLMLQLLQSCSHSVQEADLLYNPGPNGEG